MFVEFLIFFLTLLPSFGKGFYSQAIRRLNLTRATSSAQVSKFSLNTYGENNFGMHCVYAWILSTISLLYTSFSFFPLHFYRGYNGRLRNLRVNCGSLHSHGASGHFRQWQLTANNEVLSYGTIFRTSYFRAYLKFTVVKLVWLRNNWPPHSSNYRCHLNCQFFKIFVQRLLRRTGICWGSEMWPSKFNGIHEKSESIAERQGERNSAELSQQNWLLLWFIVLN